VVGSARRVAALVAVPVIALAVAAVIVSGQHPAAPISAVATDTVSRVSVSIVVTPQSASVSVATTMHGLDPTMSYQLYVVTRAGRTISVCRFTGAQTSPQVVRCGADVVLGDIAFFSVVADSGAVVVTVPFGGATPTPAPAHT
jgi:anti-sigma-K factor RskA